MADEKRLASNERFTMAPVALIDLMRDGVITPQAYALFHVLWSFSDSEKRECWPSGPTLAAGIGMGSVNGMKKHLEKLVSAGLVEVFERYEDGQQLSNGYRLHPNGDAPCKGGITTVTGGVSPQRQGGYHHSDNEQEPVNNNQLTKTNLSPNRSGSERVSEKDNDKMFSNDEVILEDDHPVLMPEDWNYNETHMALMDQKLPGHDHDLVATAFAYEFDGFHSSNWDTKFSWWINHVATNEHAMSRFEETLDTFADIDPPAAIEAV